MRPSEEPFGYEQDAVFEEGSCKQSCAVLQEDVEVRTRACCARRWHMRQRPKVSQHHVTYMDLAGNLWFVMIVAAAQV